MKIFIKIGIVWERSLIDNKKYKKNNIFHLENINKNRDCLGKNSYLSLKYKKKNIVLLENINKNRECLGRHAFLS